MTQILHIFRKDLRHQWIDLTLYVVALVLLGSLIPTAWTGRWLPNDRLPLLLLLVKIAVPTLWLVMIVRLIHAESLTGSRQFWTTRPYRWTSLLGAKMLFLAACIALPYLLMQFAVAAYGGVSPWNVGLLGDAVAHAIYVWIPALIVAAITPSLAAAFFTILGAVIVWTLVSLLFAGTAGAQAEAPFAASISVSILVVVLVLVLLQLYRRRSLRTLRVLLGVGAVLFFLFVQWLSRMSPTSPGAFLLKANFPENASTVRLTYVPDLQQRNKNLKLSGVWIPVQIAGLPDDNRLTQEAVQYRVEAGGYSYASPWRPAFRGPGGLLLTVPPEVMGPVHNADSRLTISLAAEQVAPDKTMTTAVQDRFAIPGGGVCFAINPPYEGRSFQTFITCRHAFLVPQFTEVQTHLDDACPDSLPPLGWPHRDVSLSMDPVVSSPVNGAMRANAALARCEVKSLTVTTYRTVGRFRTSLEIPSIRLADHRFEIAPVLPEEQ